MGHHIRRSTYVHRSFLKETLFGSAIEKSAKLLRIIHKIGRHTLCNNLPALPQHHTRLEEV